MRTQRRPRSDPVTIRAQQSIPATWSTGGPTPRIVMQCGFWLKISVRFLNHVLQPWFVYWYPFASLNIKELIKQLSSNQVTSSRNRLTYKASGSQPQPVSFGCGLSPPSATSANVVCEMAAILTRGDELTTVIHVAWSRQRVGCWCSDVQVANFQQSLLTQLIATMRLLFLLTWFNFNPSMDK